MFRLLTVVFLICGVEASIARTATAQDTSEAQAWAQVLATGRLTDTWRTHLEVQPRFMDGASELGLTLIRTAVGRQVTKRASVWLGHAWVPRTLGSGVRHEQRLWQQLILVSPVLEKWTVTTRLRLEQRWLDPWDDNSHRVRTLVRAQRPLGSEGWSVATYNEAMFTIDRTERGPQRGYDRNRLYGGLVCQLSTAVSVEGGYIWENSTIQASRRRNDHVAIAVLNLAMPRRP